MFSSLLIETRCLVDGQRGDCSALYIFALLYVRSDEFLILTVIVSLSITDMRFDKAN
jgi:hypothetical protein